MFSGGKDSVAALGVLNASDRHEVTDLVATWNEGSGRVALHGTPLKLLRAQADSLGLRLTVIGLPGDCDNDTYIERVAHGLTPLADAGVSAIAFGDLYLDDIRKFREKQFEGSGFRVEFPIWGRDTGRLAREQIGRGVEAIICCVDLEALPAGMLGRRWDLEFVASLPDGVDPCGENGEFHTFVVNAPEMQRRIDVRPGKTQISHDRFCMLDLQPA